MEARQLSTQTRRGSGFETTHLTPRAEMANNHDARCLAAPISLPFTTAYRAAYHLSRTKLAGAWRSQKSLRWLDRKVERGGSGGDSHGQRLFLTRNTECFPQRGNAEVASRDLRHRCVPGADRSFRQINSCRFWTRIVRSNARSNHCVVRSASPRQARGVTARIYRERFDASAGGFAAVENIAAVFKYQAIRRNNAIQCRIDG